MVRKRKSQQLTPLELEIMKVLWDTGPATVQAVQNLLHKPRHLRRDRKPDFGDIPARETVDLLPFETVSIGCSNGDLHPVEVLRPIHGHRHVRLTGGKCP